jgi:hypothetical protein
MFARSFVVKTVPVIVSVLAIALAVGVIALFREIRYQQRAADLLVQVNELAKSKQQFQDFDHALRERGFFQIKIPSGQVCGNSLAYYPRGARCVRYSGHGVHMDFMVMPDDRVATVVPGWD